MLSDPKFEGTHRYEAQSYISMKPSARSILMAAHEHPNFLAGLNQRIVGFPSSRNCVSLNHEPRVLPRGKTEVKDRSRYIGFSRITPDPGLPIMTDSVRNEFTRASGKMLRPLAQDPGDNWQDKHTPPNSSPPYYRWRH